MPVTTARWRAILLGYYTVLCVCSTDSRRSRYLIGRVRHVDSSRRASMLVMGYWTSQRKCIAIDQCEDGGAHGISSIAYQIGQPDRLNTNIFAVTSVGLGWHRVECVACSERHKR